jgi:protein-L-isoaspartate O-methyltransferase
MIKMLLEKYNFRQAEFPLHPIQDAIKQTRGRDTEGNPKYINKTNKEMVQVLRESCKDIDVPEKFFQALEYCDRGFFIDWDNISEEIKEKVKSPYTFLACPFEDGQTVPAANLRLVSLVNNDFIPQQNILEIGAGSGYNAALIAHIVGEKGHVYSTEIRPNLVKRARSTIHSIGLGGIVDVLSASEKYLGAPEYGPYDRIITTVAATKEEHLDDLFSQLAIGGLLSCPVIALRDDGGIKPWIPGESLSPDLRVDSDPSKSFAYVSSYRFMKVSPDTIEYAVQMNCNLEKKTGAGPYFIDK